MRSARAWYRWRQLAAVVVLACVATPVFNLVTSEASLRSALQGVTDAILIALLVGGYLMFVRDGWLREWFRGISFAQDLALSSAIVLALFLAGRGAGQVLTHFDPARFVHSFSDPHLLYALPFFALLAIGVQFVLQMSRLLGSNVLGYFAAGTYHRPRDEERIFLFLDLEGSTQLAEKLGSARYFELLRCFVDDLTGPVLDAQGEIYQYAGDEVVITWPMQVGARSANCIRCFFAIRASIERQRARYLRDFGAVPRFRGGIHGGTVTAGELGDLRQQIVFVGDILNTAARLETYAKQAGFELVVSGLLLERLALPPEVTAQHCGELTLKGKRAPVSAYRLNG